MLETAYEQNANTLNITFSNYNGQKQSMSREFVICGLVTVQFRTALQYIKDSGVKLQTIQIILTKTFESDHLTQIIEVSSDILEISKKKFIVDYESSEPCWQVLFEKQYSAIGYGSNQSCLPEFDIKIKLKIDTSSKTNTAFSLLYDDMDLTDFELRGKDGTVKVHKAVLASISPVMKTMLTGEWKEASSGAVEIPNTTKETLQQLKDYMYLKKLPESGLEKLAALACCYMMADFEELCTAKLLLTLTKDNVEELTDFAVEYRMRKFKIAIMLAIQSGNIDVKDMVKKIDSEIKVQSTSKKRGCPNSSNTNKKKK